MTGSNAARPAGPAPPGGNPAGRRGRPVSRNCTRRLTRLAGTLVSTGASSEGPRRRTVSNGRYRPGVRNPPARPSAAEQGVMNAVGRAKMPESVAGRGHRTVPHTADLRVEAWAAMREQAWPRRSAAWWTVSRRSASLHRLCRRRRQGDPAAAFEARHLADVALRHLRAGAVTLVMVGDPSSAPPVRRPSLRLHVS
jgi:hypothetical protein